MIFSINALLQGLMLKPTVLLLKAMFTIQQILIFYWMPFVLLLTRLRSYATSVELQVGDKVHIVSDH
ncbi:hypothetical protein Megvenef_01468 [Candidatus Megaera venefica]|uniref:Uncharacterized protein n=1 Tax=Candidatus Megaera venefica TaxID=2055910 RepID=A0ABU5NEA1_9RICK|nr:hypothetical protein [Candidatus Megaera venefica]